MTDGNNWLEILMYGKKFVVEARGRMLITGGAKDICARNGVQSKAEAIRLIRAYKAEVVK